MGEEKWMRRKAGRVSGTVVPPPAGNDPPPLPRPRNPGRSRHRPEAYSPGRVRSPLPELPDNVRSLFQPVLRPRGSRAGRDRGTDTRVRTAWSSRGSDARGLRSRSPHGAAVREWPPVQAGEPGRTGGALGADRRARGEGPHDGPAGSWASAGAGHAARAGTALAPDPPATVLGSWQASRSAGRRPAGGAGRRHAAWLATLTVLLLLTAAGTTVALLGQRSGSGKPAGRGSGTGLAGAARARADAARWVSREVSRSSIVGCDSVMCALLVKAGVPSSDLMLVRPSTQDPLGADVIVATSDLQSQFGPRLSTEYAPAVLASFGTGSSRVDVRVLAAEGAAAYQLALTRDIAARELQGTQLLGNKAIALPPSAETELAAGQVDPRLLITLPALANKQPIRVLAFYNRAPGASSGVPLTGVKLAGSDPKADLAPRAYVRWLANFLHSQRSLYRAASVTTTWHRGRAVVLIKFALPNPIGLLH